MKIPFAKLNEMITDEHRQIINDVLKSGVWIQNEYVEQLEKRFAQYIGHKYAIAISSGSCALFLALNALKWYYKIQEVGVPSFTFIADLNSIIQNNLKPVLFDVNQDFLWEGNFPVKIVVHLFGCPNFGCLQKDSIIIEDVAQAMGGNLNKQKLGSLGTVSCYSFYPTKNLWTIGEGGMITTNKLFLAEYLRVIRDYGGRKHSWFFGYNMRMSELEAAIVLLNLKYLDKWNQYRRKIARIYRDELERLVPDFLKFQRDDEGHVYWTFPVLAKDRNRLYFWLKKEGIQTLIHYPLPLHWHFAFQKQFGRDFSFPIAEYVSQNILSLPCSPAHSEDEILEVCKKIYKFYLR
jgi:dTDP-4-amino-4,6-dideoxygalactose transaminase